MLAMLILWSIVGIINLIACIMKMKADWPTYWFTYLSLMIVLITAYGG